MPNNIKAMISLLTLVVGGGVHYFERQAGNMDLHGGGDVDIS